MAYANDPDRPAALVTIAREPVRSPSGSQARIGSGPQAQTFDCSPDRTDDRLQCDRPPEAAGENPPRPPQRPRPGLGRLPCAAHPREDLRPDRRLPGQAAGARPWPARPGSTSAPSIRFQVYPPRTSPPRLAGAGLFWPGPPDDDRLRRLLGRPAGDRSRDLARAVRPLRPLLRRRPARRRPAARLGPADGLHAGRSTRPGTSSCSPTRASRASPPSGGTISRRRGSRVWQDVDRELARLLAGARSEDDGGRGGERPRHGAGPHRRSTPTSCCGKRGARRRRRRQDPGRRAPPPTRSAPAASSTSTSTRPRRPPPRPARPSSPTGRWTGEKPVERVFTRQEAAAGSASTTPTAATWSSSSARATSSTDLPRERQGLGPDRRFGMHGYLNTHRSMHAIYMALGAGIAPGNAGTVRNPRSPAGWRSGWGSRSRGRSR